MPTPKRRISTRRKGKRRASQKLSLPSLVKCPACGQSKRPHRICPECGKYNK